MNDEHISDTMKFMTEQYGTNIKHRHAKLKEEMGELDEALTRYEVGNADIDEVLSESADVMAVILHIIWLEMGLPVRMFAAVVSMMMTRARMKMERRVMNSEYQRLHPHRKNAEAGEK